jgi:hypothetical protein
VIVSFAVVVLGTAIGYWGLGQREITRADPLV